MSRFHESVRDILQDVNSFLSYTLQYERLSAATLAHKETILMKLTHLSQEYQQLHLTIPEQPSTPPYIDMKGNGTDYVLEEESENQYGCIPDSPVELERKLINPGNITTPHPPISPVLEGRVLKKGYLEKKADLLGGLLAPYQRRWCTIQEHFLTYYGRPTDKREHGQINLIGYEARPSAGLREGGFELVCPGKKTHQFASSSEQDMHEWIAVVERINLVHNGRSIASINSTARVQTNETKAKTEEIEEDEPLYDDGLSTAGGICYVENPNQWYVGLWDCNADTPTDLAFSRGDMIHVVNKLYDDWWVGELNGKFGLIPKAYLMEAYELVLESNVEKDIDV